MGKAEDKRAAIVAQQATRELAERAARGLTGTAQSTPKRRSNWAATTSHPRPGRPRNPHSS